MIENSPAPKFAELKKYFDTSKYDYLALYFYPKDFTSGCIKEACSLRDGLAELEKNKIKVLGVSPDTKDRHDKFKTKYSLPFEILADENKELAKAYNVWREKNMYGRKYMGIVRTTFIIDNNGKIVSIINKVDTSNHARQILDEIKKNPIKNKEFPSKHYQYVNAEDNIQEVITTYPGIEIIFTAYGLHCANCIASGFDTLEKGAALHNFNKETFEMMLRDANETVKELISEE